MSSNLDKTRITSWKKINENSLKFIEEKVFPHQILFPIFIHPGTWAFSSKKIMLWYDLWVVLWPIFWGLWMEKKKREEIWKPKTRVKIFRWKMWLSINHTNFFHVWLRLGGTGWFMKSCTQTEFRKEAGVKFYLFFLIHILHNHVNNIFTSGRLCRASVIWFSNYGTSYELDVNHQVMRLNVHSSKVLRNLSPKEGWISGWMIKGNWRFHWTWKQSRIKLIHFQVLTSKVVKIFLFSFRSQLFWCLFLSH